MFKINKTGAIDKHFEGARTLYFMAARDESYQCGEAKIAAFYFCQSLASGHPRAAYNLYGCFDIGIGVPENETLAALFFGVAKKIGAERCNKHDVKIPNSLYPLIDKVFDFIRDANVKMKDDEESFFYDMPVQSQKLMDMIVLPNCKPIINYFVIDLNKNSSNTYDSGHFVDDRQEDVTLLNVKHTGDLEDHSCCCCSIL